MTDTLHQEPERDQFKTESPIRAFTTWTVQGLYALGKGFRPSLAHLVPYLHAMDSKEGWQLVQVLEAGSLTPSFIFRQSRVIPDEVLIDRLRGDEGFKQSIRDLLNADDHPSALSEIAERSFEIRGKVTFDDVDAFLKERGLVLAASPDGCYRIYKAESERPETYALEYFTREEDGTVSMTRGTFDDAPQWLQEALPNFGIEPPYIRNREGFEEAGRKIDQAREMSADLDGFGEPAVPTPTYPIMPEIAEKPAAVAMAARMDQHDYGDMQPEDEPLGALYDATPPISAIGGQPPISAIGDDPINPKHYGGTACAEIGELLTANSYQVLKYNWRLGEKDSPCVEIGKSIWYLDRELAMIAEGHTFIPGDDRLPDHTFFDHRLQGRSEHTAKIARSLISWNRYGNPETLKLLRRVLQGELDRLDGCKDWGSGLAI